MLDYQYYCTEPVYGYISFIFNLGKALNWTYKEWDKKIEENFEKKFYVDENTNESMANKRQIYKDCYKSSQIYSDYQLRPNFPIAMCVVRKC